MRQELKQRNIRRKKRTQRTRKKLKGSATKPRLSVFKSLKHISCQLIDDDNGVTLASFGTQAKGVEGHKKSREGARFVGEKIAEIAKEKKIGTVVFDRGRFQYHGLVAELALGARSGGLKF
ncbi:MAG: 50S ribosomal protein L18 [Chlamydiota bacterium]